MDLHHLTFFFCIFKTNNSLTKCKVDQCNMSNKWPADS